MDIKDFQLYVMIFVTAVLIFNIYASIKQARKIKQLKLQLESKERDITGFSNELTNCKRSEKTCQLGQQTLSEEIELQKGLVKDRDKTILNIEAKNLQRKEAYFHKARLIQIHSDLVTTLMLNRIVAYYEGALFMTYSINEEGQAIVIIKEGKRNVKKEAVLGYEFPSNQFVPLSNIQKSQNNITTIFKDAEVLTEEGVKQLEEEAFGLLSDLPTVPDRETPAE